MSEENKLREELKAQAAEVIDALSLEELEELKAQAAEAIDALSLEELEKVAGGGLFDILKEIGKGSWKGENP